MMKRLISYLALTWLVCSLAQAHDYTIGESITTEISWTSWTCACVHCTPDPNCSTQCLGDDCSVDLSYDEQRTATIDGSTKVDFRCGITWKYCNIGAGYEQTSEGHWEKTQTFHIEIHDSIEAGECGKIAYRLKDEKTKWVETIATHTFWGRDGHCPTTGHAGRHTRTKVEWQGVLPESMVVSCAWDYCSVTKPPQQTTQPIPVEGDGLDGNCNPCSGGGGGDAW